MRIGRGVLHRAIFMIVKSACVVAATDEQIQKAVREGLNTIRLHDRETRNRILRLPQQEEGTHHSDDSQPEFINAPDAQDDNEDQEPDD